MTTTKTKTSKESTTQTPGNDLMTHVRNCDAGIISGPVIPKIDPRDFVNVISADSPLADIIKFVLTKCIATLAEDIDNLTPKDRIMLWKEYGSYFEPEEVKLSQVPGANIKELTVNILHNGE